MNLCRITLKIVNIDGRVLPGASITSARVTDASGTRQAAYELTKLTDSNGEIYFDVPQGGRVRIESVDVAELNGTVVTAGRTNAFFAGVFKGDTASEAGVRARSGAGAVPAAAAAADTLIATEYGDEACRQTIIRMISHPITVGNTTGVSFGGDEIYAFPEGRILVHGCVRKPVTFGLGNAGNVTPIADTHGGDVAIGTTAPTDGTLTGTDVDLNPSTSIDPISGGAAGAALAAAAAFDGTSAAKKAYFNILIDDADVADGASDVIEVSCEEIRITWSFLGDTA